MRKNTFSCLFTIAVAWSASAPLRANEERPRPSSMVSTPDIAAYVQLADGSDESRRIAQFIGSLNFYKDLEDPSLWWVSPRYGVDSTYPATIVPNQSKRQLNQQLDTVWWPRIQAILGSAWDPENNDFNDDIREASVAAAVTSQEPGDPFFTSDLALKEAATKKLQDGLFRLSSTNKATLVSALVALYTEAGASIKTDLNDDELRFYLYMARNFVTHRLNLNVVRGLTGEEYEMLGKFGQTVGIKIKTLPLTGDTLDINPTYMSESGVDSNGNSAIRAPGDQNVFGSSIASNSSRSLPVSGGIVSFALDWNGYKGIVETLSSADADHPGYLLLPLGISGSSIYRYNSQGLFRCQGSSQLQSEFGLQFSKSTNDDQIYSPIPTRVVNEVNRNWFCSLETAASDFDRRTLEDLRGGIEQDFIGNFSQSVRASQQMREEMLQGWIQDGRKTFYNYMPEHLHKTLESRTSQRCWEEIQRKCAGFLCLRRKTVKIPKCESTLQWFENFTKEVIPLNYFRKESFNDFVNAQRDYTVQGSSEFIVKAKLSTGICLIGVPRPMDSQTFNWKACNKYEDVEKAAQSTNLETIGGVTPFPLQDF
ncbi:MAG TPA: hypothetical protein VE954_32520 [Oligoflexus sp.]|uniref:hypothetical protein n=1 Tax=Oligoflexus sp. TaxID=1971216 RepID=UPI002D487F9B|nr:hypothetical protein [Oligoflexus sp.]HYX37853.1 hypothetical protein [Oligoflexus sp.]